MCFFCFKSCRSTKHTRGSSINRKFSKEEKYQLIARYVSDICTEAGVARSTFYTWLKPCITIYTDTGHAVSAAGFVKDFATDIFSVALLFNLKLFQTIA